MQRFGWAAMDSSGTVAMAFMGTGGISFKMEWYWLILLRDLERTLFLYPQYWDNYSCGF